LQIYRSGSVITDVIRQDEAVSPPQPHVSIKRRSVVLNGDIRREIALNLTAAVADRIAFLIK
jgi:hypothetical protein